MTLAYNEKKKSLYVLTKKTLFAPNGKQSGGQTKSSCEAFL